MDCYVLKAVCYVLKAVCYYYFFQKWFKNNDIQSLDQ